MAERGPHPAPQAGPPDPVVRQHILEAVLDHPGLHVRGIARLIDITPSLVEYHAARLIDAELITEAVHEGYRRFFPRPGPDRPTLEESEHLALLREPVPLHLVLLMARYDHATPHAELVDAVGMAKSTVAHHLQKLVDVGLTERTARGRYGLTDPERTRRLLARYRPVPALLRKHWPLWIDVYRNV